MVKVGDRVAKVDKLGQHELRGTVTEIHGELIHVEWDDGHESSVIPGPGTLKVLENKTK